MKELAIVDIDGVVANSTARFQKAEEAKQAFLNSPEGLKAQLICSDAHVKANAKTSLSSAALTSSSKPRHSSTQKQPYGKLAWFRR